MTLADYVRSLATLSVDFAVHQTRAHYDDPDVWPLEHDEATWDRMFAAWLGVTPVPVSKP